MLLKSKQHVEGNESRDQKQTQDHKHWNFLKINQPDFCVGVGIPTTLMLVHYGTEK